MFDGAVYNTFVVQCTQNAHMSLGLTETVYTNTQYSDWWNVATGNTAEPTIGFHPHTGGTMSGSASSNYGTTTAGRYYQIRYGDFGNGDTWKEEACDSNGCNTIATHAKSVTLPLRPTVNLRGSSVNSGGGNDDPIVSSTPSCTAYLTGTPGRRLHEEPERDVALPSGAVFGEDLEEDHVRPFLGPRWQPKSGPLVKWDNRL